MKKKIILSVLGLGAIFIALIFTAPNDIEKKRYQGAIEEINADVRVKEFDLPKEVS